MSRRARTLDDPQWLGWAVETMLGMSSSRLERVPSQILLLLDTGASATCHTSRSVAATWCSLEPSPLACHLAITCRPLSSIITVGKRRHRTRSTFYCIYCSVCLHASFSLTFSSPAQLPNQPSYHYHHQHEGLSCCPRRHGRPCYGQAPVPQL